MLDYFAKRNFSIEQIPDLTGKIAIITGSSTGIGKVCALEMARKGCTVVLACRNQEKTKTVVEEIKAETGNQNVDFIQLDLLKLDSVTKFAQEFKSRYTHLHILLNNAGVMMSPFALSEDGIESQFATNHVAHYYLTMLLLPVLECSTPSRIVNVSSMAHNIHFKKLNLETISDPKKYNRTIHYAKSKTCNILFTRELTKRLEAKGSNVFVNANHPGIVASDLSRHIVGINSLGSYLYNKLLCISAEDGALTQLYLATSPDVENEKIKGKYYVPFANVQLPNGVASQDDTPLELWNFTENLLKEKVKGYEGAPI
ncbi:uncharacterized protein EV154DRAFT_550547 [Mucor mucedo]|uniref:uncharacterized protein n=1 Tax=Mucor mucedo TaxID=29922 RepID=UPI0022209A1C|nr:uncharacterized protein EV154DRAFT_550547 [Mucor mucedo]KAI7892597.1 hypothetical protein EV154DRAFT_550547 [Mucor mucedo]